LNQRIVIGVSLVLNLIFVPPGSVYLIRKAGFLRTLSAETQQSLQSTQPEIAEDYVSTLDYQWQKHLFEEEPLQNGAVVFVGDSLTSEGHWQQVWREQTLQPILNRGLVGDRMEGVIARIEEVTRHHPLKIFIMIGINDLRFEQKKPDDLVNQYRTLLHKINEESPASRVYLQSLLPVRGETNKTVTKVNEQLSRMADGKSIHYVNLHPLMTDSQGELRDDWTFDGVHLRAVAYQTWRDQVWPLVK
jgi:lysophospholipase L1-like esterase